MSELRRVLSPAGIGAAAIGIVVLLLAILLLQARCSADEARRAKGDAALAEGRTASAVAAIDEISKLNDRGVASDADVEQAHDAIRQADPADRDRIARYRLCLLQQRPDCDRLQRPGPVSPHP